MRNGKFEVTLDPGHAKGSDKSGCHGFSEQRDNLAVALKLKAKLEATGKIIVNMTRSNEIDDPSLGQRGRAGARKDLLFCIHTNGAHGTAHGVTIFYSVDLPGDKQWALLLGSMVANALGTNFRGASVRPSGGHFSKPDPSTQEDYYTVIDSAQDSGCRHVLLSESGFHDNEHDWAAMHTAAGIEARAECHAIVACKILGVAYPPAVVVPPEPPKPPVSPVYFTTTLLCYTLYAVGKKFGVDWKTIRQVVSEKPEVLITPNPGAMRPGLKLRIK